MCMNLYISHVGRQEHFSTQIILVWWIWMLLEWPIELVSREIVPLLFSDKETTGRSCYTTCQSCWWMFCHCQQIFQRSHTLQDIPIWFFVASLTTRENGCAERWWSTFVTVSGISYFQSAKTIEYRLKVQKAATGNKQQTHCNSSLTSANMENKDSTFRHFSINASFLVENLSMYNR